LDPRESGLPNARVIAARGPFALADERALLERERIQILVSKNSGTDATYAKIEAARTLQLPVIMLARPPRPAAECVESLDQILRWLEALHGH
jgi:precorrin-6A/cobalt-precorrin-6A reductase